MKRASSLWTADAEEVFIMLWEQKLDELRRHRKNSHVYQEMAAEMRMQGYDVDSTSVKTKIDNLTAKYRKFKSAMGSTGGLPPSWHLYEQVHRIIGGLVLNNVDKLAGESFKIRKSPSDTHDSPPIESSPQLSRSSSPLPSPLLSPLPSAISSRSSEKSAKKKQFERLANVCEDMQNNFSKSIEQFCKSNEELVKLERAKLIAMQSLQEDTKGHSHSRNKM